METVSMAEYFPACLCGQVTHTVSDIMMVIVAKLGLDNVPIIQLQNKQVFEHTSIKNACRKAEQTTQIDTLAHCQR